MQVRLVHIRAVLTYAAQYPYRHVRLYEQKQQMSSPSDVCNCSLCRCWLCESAQRPSICFPAQGYDERFFLSLISVFAPCSGAGIEELHSIMFIAAQHGWNDVWVDDEDDEGNSNVRWIGSANDRFIDPEWRDAQGRTALMHAASKGHAEFVWNLLKKGADANATDPHGHTALFFLLMGSDDDEVDDAERDGTLAVLLENGVGLHVGNSDRVTPLM